MEQVSEKTMDRMEEIQKELWEYVGECHKTNPTVAYQDMVTIFFCLKIAQLEEQLASLKKETK